MDTAQPKLDLGVWGAMEQEVHISGTGLAYDFFRILRAPLLGSSPQSGQGG